MGGIPIAVPRTPVRPVGINRDLARGTQNFILGPVPGGEGWESRYVGRRLKGRPLRLNLEKGCPCG